MKLSIANQGNSALSSAAYDPKSGKLSLELDENKLLNSKKFNNIRHIDSFKLNGKSYNLNIHSDKGPKDSRGRYIYNKQTTNHAFEVNVGKNLDFSNGMTLKFHDGDWGRGPQLHQTTIRSDAKPQTPITQHQKTLETLSSSANYAGGMTMSAAAKALNVSESALTAAIRPERYGKGIGLSNGAVNWMRHVKKTHGTEVMLEALKQPNVRLWKPGGTGKLVMGIAKEFGNAIHQVKTTAKKDADKTDQPKPKTPVTSEPQSSSDYTGGMTLSAAADALNVELNLLTKALRPGRYGDAIGLSDGSLNWLRNTQKRYGTSVMLKALSKPYVKLWKPQGTGPSVMSIAKEFSFAIQQTTAGK